MPNGKRRKASGGGRGRFTAGDQKPLAAFRLGFYFRQCGQSYFLEDFENILQLLAEDILPNPFATMQALLTVDPEYREKFDPSLSPRSGWNVWQPSLALRQRLATVADTALPKSNTYRRWYDFGRLLGEDGKLDISVLRQVIRLLPNEYLGRITVLKEFLRLTVRESDETSGLERILRQVLNVDAKTQNVIRAFANTVMVDLQKITQTENLSCSSPSDRNGWIYREYMNGTPYDQIIDGLNGNTSGWTPIKTPNGIKGAAYRYADKNELPRPQIRQPGRPKKTEHDR